MTSPKNARGAKRDGPNYSTSTSTGVEPNVAAALSYILGLITGALFLVLEKENRFVRFHAAQSVAISVILIVVSIAVSMLSRILVLTPVIGRLAVFILTTGLALGTFVFWLLLMWRAYQREELELPVAGGIARRMV
ncbi:MAG: DUF4870 domain-containing protein [Gemmatimonadaceae bacterium]